MSRRDAAWKDQYFLLYSRHFRRFRHATSDTPDAPGASHHARRSESRVIAPFTLIFNIELPLNSHLPGLVWMPLKSSILISPQCLSKSREESLLLVLGLHTYPLKWLRKENSKNIQSAISDQISMTESVVYARTRLCASTIPALYKSGKKSS